MTFGYHQRALHIDVTDGHAEFREFSDETLRRYLGGAGLGTWMLLAEGAAELAPLSPAAPLVFAFSPLVGSPLTTSAKFAVVSKSPLTERLNDSLASSGFAIAGKKCGCDAFLITGRAAEPSILVIDDGQVRLEPADDLWGATCPDTERILQERLGRDFQMAVIGPAGERQVRYATISHDGRHAGRGGSGAVMGAKNIKAIAVRGRQRVEWAEPQNLIALSKRLSAKSLGPATEKYRELGTASNLLTFNRLGVLPTRNFQQGHFEQAELIAPETLATTRSKTRAYCASCTIGCEHIYALQDDGSENSRGVRLEYENLFALGPLCGISDPETVLRASQRCDDLGFDTISAGGTIAFVMECVSRGLLTAEETELQFGDGRGLLDAIEMIGYRRGFGDALANGSRHLAAQIGQGAEDFAPHVKGMELPGYEPRALQMMALGFAVGTRGADHNRSSAYEVDFSADSDRRQAKPQDVHLAVDAENRAALMDSMILCKFLRGVLSDFAAEAATMLNQVTGWDSTADELWKTANRIIHAKKWFNVQAGWQPTEDTLPKRFLEEPLPDDPLARLTAQSLNALATAYNRQRGWSDDGFLTTEQIAELGI